MMNNDEDPRRASRMNRFPSIVSTTTGGEMPSTERELADDAHWKVIQKNTFTRWANEHLRQVNKVISDLDFDLHDGVRLIALVEVLSGKKLPKFNRRPSYKNQKLENVSICLDFLQIEEGIKLVNIDSSDIVSCNSKLILGLMWTLILHYSISMPMWDGLENATTNNNQTPKQKLLGWITSRIPDRPIRNFTTDWNDGTAIGALVDAVAPGLCPDWTTWNPKNNVANATEAMSAAEQWLDVPQLIKPVEMCNPKVDEMSMMTYLSQFPSAKMKQGAPLRPRTNPSRVRAIGPGIEPAGNTCGIPARFTVETFNAGRGDLDIRVLNPRGVQEPCQVLFNNDKLISYHCIYVPTIPGTYQIEVKFAGQGIPKSPFAVKVDGSPGEPSKVTVRGPGIEKSGVVVKRKAIFDVLTKNAGNGVVDVTILDPAGHKDTVRPMVIKKPDDSVWSVDYVPISEGLHKVSVLFAGKPIPGSPFSVVVSPGIEAHKCHVTGRGIQPKGVRVDDHCDFTVHTENAGGDAEVIAKVVGSGGVEEKLTLKRLDPKTYEFSYVPKRTGLYVVSITYGGQGVARSPFRVDVGPKKDSKIRAFGPGLQYGIVGYPACFTVDTNGETGALGFSIEGPSQAKIDCKDNGDGSADISYWPTAPGEYAVHILCNEEDIPQSPFMVDVSPTTTKFDPTKVEVHGPGILKTGMSVSKWAEFVVDARRAGHAPLHVVATEPNYFPVEVVVKDNKDGTYNCRYMPKRGVKHVVVISYGNVAVPNSPFRVLVQEASNPSRVKVFGPALDRPVRVHQPTHLMVDCSEAGPGDVAIALTNERGIDVPVKTTDAHDSTFRIDFEATSVGAYSVCVFFGELEIPNSPYKIQVQPNVDVAKVAIQGLEDKVYVESLNDFTIDPRALGSQGHGKIKAILTDPAGSRTDVPITSNKDGTLAGIYTPLQKGVHKLDVTYDGVVVPPSPFHINVVGGSDPSRVKAFGTGLKGGITNQPQKFTVETKGAGVGGLGLAIEGPSEAKLNCSDNRNGSCTVEYLPTKSGIYDIVIKFGEKPIPGSPFHVEIVDEINPQKVRCYGPGVDSKGVRKGQSGNFTIDASQAGAATPEVSATDLRGRKRPGQVKPRGNGLFDATYFLDVEGPSKVEVTFAGRPVPGSPFNSRILPPYDATKVHVTGEGVKPQGVTASLPTTFLMDTRDAGLADHDVVVLDPAGDFVRPKILDKGDGTFVVTYTPCDVGRFTIQIKYGGDPVPLSPFYVMTSATGDASKVKIIDGIESIVPVGEKHIITLDTSFAGFGNVTCNMHSPNDSDVDIDIIDNHNGTVNVVYVPRLPGVYTINLKFGGQPIPKGQFSQQAVDPSTLVEKQNQPLTASAKPTTGSGKSSLDPVDFLIPVGPIFSFVSAEVTTPSGKKHMPKLDDNRDGMVAILYTPSELGLHRLDVRYNKAPVNGSPFHFYVYSLHSGHVTASGRGLSHGIIGQLCHFTIFTKDAGAGGLSLAVEGPSKAEINCVDNKDGTCSVSYLPSATGEYSVIIRFDDKHIIGSPFTAKIMHPAGEDPKTSKILVGTNSEVSLEVSEKDLSSLTASIRSPSGKEEPCTLKRLANGQLGISFVPREVGDYLVSVFRHGKHIPNSPFRITVSESQIGNAAQVRAYGKGLTTGSANETSEFYVDTKNAGYGNLSLSIEGPSKADMDCEDNDNNTCRVMYRPTEPGSYIINIKFAEEHIPGSPFLVKIDGEPTGKVTERIVRQKDAADVTHVGSDCELSLRIPGASRYDLEASVTSPSGSSEPCTVQDRTENNYSIRFVPREMGLHMVTVRHKGLHVSGSPFQFTVGPIIQGGADKVRALGPGLEHGEVSIPCKFNVYTREAGAGGLSIAVEGPSKAEIDFEDRKDGSCEVSYVCSEPGEYVATVKFNDDHIPGSPFRVHVAPSAADAKKLNVHQLQGRNLEVNKPAAFAVDLNGVKGKLDARVLAPSGAEEQAVIQELDKNRCAVRFIPRENGLHMIHVRSNGSQIPGSPYRVQVGQEGANASLVRASGEGLSKGMCDQLCKFLVNTSKAGAGALAVTIDGPSKVQLSCYETPDGYEFMYTPTQPGEYHVNVRYAGNTHIPGSPFKVHIEGLGKLSGWAEQSDVIVESVTKMSTTQKYAAAKKLHNSDATKISATGTGLQRATANKEATFTVDTTRAGYNVLMVGILGGNVPCEEVLVKHIGQKQYSVSYVVHERGEYQLIIKWGDQNIPGSPFLISVL